MVEEAKFPSRNEEPTPAEKPSASASAESATEQISASSKKQAFEDVMTPLTTSDLAEKGTQKLILYMLNEAKSENVRLEGFVERFHDADKRSAILQEQLAGANKLSKATEIAFGVGTTFGGACIGSAYFLWSRTPAESGLGLLAFIFGVALLIGGVAVKVAKR